MAFDNSLVKILIVDDTPENLEIVGFILNDQGYDIYLADSGQWALELINTTSFDLILLDIMMPEMDGLEVCRRIRTLPEHKHLPIIFLTAKTDIESITQGFEHGANDYIGKPFYAPELLARVKNQVELKTAKDRLAYEVEEKNHFLQSLLSLGDGVIATDELGNIRVMNPVAESLTEWNRADALGQPLDVVLTTVDVATGQICLNPVSEVLKTGIISRSANQRILISKTGKEIPIEDYAAPIKNRHGGRDGTVLVFRDCSEKRENSKQVEYLSEHDHLTGLYNRRFMDDALMSLDIEKNLPLSVMAIDINGLKKVNDTFGHELGDRVLENIANVLKKSCREDDVIARIGGDEFLILFPRTNELQAERIKQRIEMTTKHLTLDSVIISLAIGYAIKTNEEQDLLALKMEAENRMYKTKQKHSSIMRNQAFETVLRNINQNYGPEQIHTDRVSEYCAAIADNLGFSEKEIDDLRIAGSLHDIGKIIVAPELLNSPRRLTEQEFGVLRQHPETGCQMLKSVNEYAHLSEFVLSHHERWDGKGYPLGLERDAIPLGARIIAVADTYEAMTANRSYQETKNKNDAIAELLRCSGSQFDPEIVSVFVEKVLK